ncbi:hypothetical protein EVAR_55086_1 [Eumeta japonica]|uniref:Uncharacterized protein n=1 Tax=Eumeta variegata TaxID=151549 RepID=A0A4C1YFA0_EUMVA|nr:hypothetical protein EVAR_55086_1 [Eumeta japonica]
MVMDNSTTKISMYTKSKILEGTEKGGENSGFGFFGMKRDAAGRMENFVTRLVTTIVNHPQSATDEGGRLDLQALEPEIVGGSEVEEACVSIARLK